MKVLCVDDEPLVLLGLAHYLRRDFDVRTAASGAAALALLSEERDVAVLLSDLQMPGMDGLTFFERARALVPRAVSILLTGAFSEAYSLEPSRVYRTLAKPCAPSELRDAVCGAATRHREDAAGAP